MQKEDWSRMDKEMLPIVKKACMELYAGENGKPGKVSAGAVSRILGLPDKRLGHLPKCQDEIKRHEEPQEIFWARKIAWNYRKLVSEGQTVSYNKLCRPLNLRKANFISALPFLPLFCGEMEEERIKGLI